MNMEKGHFARSPLCKASTNTSTQRRTTTRRVEDRDNPGTDTSSDGEQEVIQRVTEVEQERDRSWPGVQGNSVLTQFIKHVEEIRQVQSARPRKKRSRYVWVHIGGLRVKLYCDTGSRLTIIPPELYREEMGDQTNTWTPRGCSRPLSTQQVGKVYTMLTLQTNTNTT